MMKLIHSLISTLAPLASPAPAPLHALPDALTHCWKWARAGFPLGEILNAIP